MFNGWSLQGAIARSELSFARKRKSALAPEEIGVAQEPFVIVHAASLTMFDAESILVPSGRRGSGGTRSSLRIPRSGTRYR